jgi:uncharacterized membrane protein (GlpM family)
MHFAIKLLITNGVIIACAALGRRYPSLAGLLATMPLTTLAVLFWLASDHPGDRQLLAGFTRGVLWGIGPTVLFFGVAYWLLRRDLPLTWAVGAGGVAWLIGAVTHQLLLR